MDEPDPRDVAREIALRRLSLRAHSRAELAAAMARKNVPSEIIDEILERFEEVQLIDDAAFAEAWTRSRHTHRSISRRVIAQELRTKGIDPEVAREALAEVSDEDELEAARRIAAKKARSLASLDHQVARRRLAGALARRGFGSSVVHRVVTEALAGDPDETPHEPE